MFISGQPALWLVPALPALGALLIFVFASSIRAKTASLIACTSVFLSFLWVLICSGHLLGAGEHTTALHQTHWTWLNVGFLHSDIAFYFDRITMVWAFVITGVGFLIHLFSAGYMHGDEGERRYFGYLNLFVASMLVLVMADNGFFMFMGWEGVGAMSFALIGFYYSDPNNVVAAQKAFLVTRLGDIFLILGLLLCAQLAGVQFTNLLGFQEVAAMTDITSLGGFDGSSLLLVAGLLLLGGAIGKSAQLPLQVWLPDAMAGPTPVSALIHAATMVTAGVYLIARFHVLFASSQTLMAIVAGIGVATAFYGATCAIVQTDIKRILAYSTISQIGYMVLGLGVGAFSLGVFHFYTHAFYKALLFLGSGTIIHSLHGEQNIYNMGGLKNSLKGTFLAILAGCASLAGIVLTAGFFSKDAILWSSLTTHPYGSAVFYGLGLVTAFLTAIYSFRLIFIVFFGEPRKDIHVHHPGKLLTWPLFILAFFALFIGFLNMPGFVGPGSLWFEHFLHPVFGEFQAHASSNHPLEALAALASIIIALGGAFLAWSLYAPGKKVLPAPGMEIGDVVNTTPRPYQSGLANFLFHGWKMDALYMHALVRNFQRFAKQVAMFDRVFIDGIYNFIAAVVRIIHENVLRSQNGKLPRYALMMMFGAAAITTYLFIAIVMNNPR